MITLSASHPETPLSETDELDDELDPMFAEAGGTWYGGRTAKYTWEHDTELSDDELLELEEGAKCG